MPRPILLLTRPEVQSRRFADAVRARLGDALEIVISPVIAIRHLTFDADPSGYAALVFTSENGVAAFAAGSALRDRTAWCVGDRTAEAAEAEGFSEVRSASAQGGDAEALLRLILRAAPSGRLLHLRGVHARGKIAARLGEHGLPCDEAMVYDQVPVPMDPAALAAVRGESPVIVPLFSPRSARLAAEALGSASAPLYPVAISAAAAAGWNDLTAGNVLLAKHPDAEAMLDAVQDAASRLPA